MSPRKYEGRSERSGASPAYQSQSQQQDQGNNGPTTGNTSAAQNQNYTMTAAQAKQEEENDDMMVGTVPEKIEEGEEPPHRSELPT